MGTTTPRNGFQEISKFNSLDVARPLLWSSLMNAGKHCLVSLLAGLGLVGILAGCSLDDGGGASVTRIPGDPVEDARLDSLNIICQSSLTVTGTFTPNPVQPPPEDFTGCGGVGTWNVDVAVDRVGCNPQPTPPSFVYEVTYDIEAAVLEVAFPADPTNERVNLKITADASGCIGAFDHFELDNSVWAIQAPLQPDNTLVGTGEYTVFEFDSFPGD